MQKYLGEVTNMSSGLFLNFEKISLSIIENEIQQMTNNNVLHGETEECDEINEPVFAHNLYHGSIAAAFIVNLFETTLNTILCRRLECVDEDIFKTSHNIKLQLICTMYNVDISEIKSNNFFQEWQSIVRLRNDIMHFKSNMIAEGSYISASAKVPMGKSKEPLAIQFTKDYMKKHYEGTYKLLELICKKCGLVLYKDCQVIDCDGRDDACVFVITRASYEKRERV